MPWSLGWLRLVDSAFWALFIGSMFVGFAKMNSGILAPAIALVVLLSRYDHPLAVWDSGYPWKIVQT